MKNFKVMAAANGGILALRSTGLSSNTSLRTFQLRKKMNSCMEKIDKEDKDLLVAAGIEDAASFDKRRNELKQIENRSEEEEKELQEMDAKLTRYAEWRVELWNEEADLCGLKPMPFDEWRKLVDLNTDENGHSPLGHNIFYINGAPANNVDVEAELEGIAWYIPEEKEENKE